MRQQEYRNGDDGRRTRDAQIFAVNLERLASSIYPGQPVPELDSIDGTDDSGSVYCVVNLSGDIMSIGIDNGWWKIVGPTQIAAKILDAVSYAKSKAMMARLVLDRHGYAATSTPQHILTHPTKESVSTLPAIDDPTFDQALSTKIDQALDTLTQIERFRRIRDSPEERIIAGPHDLFRIILIGHQIRRAEVDASSLRPSDANKLAADARAALQIAEQSARTVAEIP